MSLDTIDHKTGSVGGKDPQEALLASCLQHALSLDLALLSTGAELWSSSVYSLGTHYHSVDFLLVDTKGTSRREKYTYKIT